MTRSVSAELAPPVHAASGETGRQILPWRPHIVVMTVTFLGALFAGWLLLPGDDERVAALERDGKSQEALRILETRFSQGDRSQRTLYQLQSFYEHFGNLDQARQTLEMLAELRPNDAQVQRRLALLYRQTQNEDAYVRVVAKQLELRYSEPVCKELVGIYRAKGDYAAEQDRLASCWKQGYRRPDDLVRLAYLMASDGNMEVASTLLKSVDDRRRLRVDRDRTMLFTALLEAGKPEEAQRRAARWLKGSKDDVLVLQLIDSLARDRRLDLAMELAGEIGHPGDSVSLAVAELMLDGDQVTGARAYLGAWLDAARLRDTDVVHRFINAALDAEDPMLAFKSAERYGFARVGQEELVAIAEAMSASNAAPEFRKLREAIAPEMLKGNPLLAAAVELERGAPEPARQLLSQVPIDGLDEWRLALWARLMESTGRGATATQTLRSIGVDPLPAPPPLPQPPPAVAARPATVAAAPPPPRIVRRFRKLRDPQTPRRSRFRPQYQQPSAFAPYPTFKQKAKGQPE